MSRHARMAYARSYKGAGMRQPKFADPGFQADGKPRYPIDSEKHVRAAWAYINVADNASRYKPSQLQHVKARIRAAMKKHGIDPYVEAGRNATRTIEGGD